jgi:hypothetical protein
MQVEVASISTPGTTQAIAVSPSISIVLDTTPPVVTITEIKLRPTSAFETFDPGRTYRTNANEIALRGIVSDGPLGVASEQITVTAQGVASPASVNADRTGRFEIRVDISREPDGPIDLRLVANDNVGGAREGNRSEAPVDLR